MSEKKSTVSSGRVVESKIAEKESVYPAEVLIKAANRFRTREECVEAALRFYGKEKATIKETDEMVKKFLKREVV